MFPGVVFVTPLLLRLTEVETGSERTGAHLGESGAEAGEHLSHVASFLHADDPQMILLIHPNQEGLVVIVPADKRKG